VINELKTKFGKWEMPWGEINRFQRITGDIDSKYDDNQPSIPVGFASALWGQIPSYNSRSYRGTNKRYGVSGNSFICAIEFGKKIKAKSLLAGGESGDPASKHFKDQALMYSKGEFKDVLFYKEDVLKHVEKNYHPAINNPLFFFVEHIPDHCLLNILIFSRQFFFLLVFLSNDQPIFSSGAYHKEYNN
jgi:acyl-homoserine-lactone acylase